MHLCRQSVYATLPTWGEVRGPFEGENHESPQISVRITVHTTVSHCISIHYALTDDTNSIMLYNKHPQLVPITILKKYTHTHYKAR